MWDSSLSFFHNSPVKKEEKVGLDRPRRQHWCSALFSPVLLHNLSKERVSGLCWCRCGNSPGLSGHFYSRVVWQLLTERRETEKNLKKANSNSRWMCCSIISSCVKFTDSKPFSAAILCIRIDLLLSHLGSPCPQHILSFLCSFTMFSSEWKYFSAWLWSAQRLNSNSLGLFWTSEVRCTSPVYRA